MGLTASDKRWIQDLLQTGVPQNRQGSTKWWQAARIKFGHIQAIRRDVESGDAQHRYEMSDRAKMARSAWLGDAIRSDNPAVRGALEDLVRRVIREEAG